VTVSPALSATPTVGDKVFMDGDPLVEFEDPTTGYHSSLASMPLATVVQTIADPYKGRRVAWRSSVYYDNRVQAGYYPIGLEYVGGLVFASYFDSYNTTGDPDHGLVATRLSDGVAFGPWLTEHIDADAEDFFGPWRAAHFTTDPNGKMVTLGMQRSGNHTMSWGPSMYRLTWPGTATASGFGAANIADEDRLAEFYFPSASGSEFFTRDGVPQATIKSFHLFGLTNYSYIYERDYNDPRAQVDPAENTVHPGYGTWTDERSNTTGIEWVQGANRRGVFVTMLWPVSPNPTSNDCNDAHEWYRQGGQIYLEYSSITGTCTMGQSMTGGTSGATATAYRLNTGYAVGNNVFHATNTPGDDFDVSETVTCQAGGTFTVLAFHRMDICNHGCTSPTAVTGPTSTYLTPVLAMFDPADLEAVAAGSKLDYTVEPVWVMDLTAAGLLTSPMTQQGRERAVSVGHVDDQMRLWIGSTGADDTISSNATQAIYHLMQLDDSAPPAPVGYFPVLPFAAAAAVWMTGSLFSRRRPWGTV
jgi:hypothetical protein